MNIISHTYRIAFLLLISGGFQFSYGQVELKADGIKECLMDNYPDVLDADDKLDLTKAQAFTGLLNCPNKNIVNTDDLIYFENVTKLYLNNNDIVDLSPIAGLDQLIQLDVNSNEIEIIPDLSTFLSLETLYINYNQLDNLPALPSSLRVLMAGNNSLAGTIDLSNNSNIYHLELFENDIKEIVGIEQMNLQILDVHTNELKLSKDLSTAINLRHVDLSDNLYTNLPLLSLESIEYLSVGQNKLTFEDLEPFAVLNLPTDSFPSYYDQEKPEEVRTITRAENSSFEWQLNFDQAIESNVYHWFKDDVEIGTSSTGVFTISSLSLADSGVYHCEVENTLPSLNGGRIITNSLTLSITKKIITTPSCFTINNLNIEQNTPSCQAFSEVTLSADVSNSLGDIVYVSNDITSDEGSFVFEEEGIFTITIADDNCSKKSEKTIEVAFDLSNCDPPSFSPNGDGLDDTYYLNYNGQGLIYNSTGELVKTITLPNTWDGTLDDGSLGDTGLYLLFVNDTHQLSITLMR